MKINISAIKSPKVFIPLIIFAALIVVPLFGNFGVSVISIMTTILLYMYWASAWNILGGYAGLFSLGSGVYIGLGAYMAAVIYANTNFPMWLALPLVGIVVGLFSLLIGYPTFRLQALYFSLATSALVQVFQLIFVNFRTIFGIRTYGSDGFKLTSTGTDIWKLQFTSKLPYYYIILALLVIVLLVSLYISKTKTGYYFRSIASNAEAASSLGVNVLAMKLKAQFISAFFLAIGGGFYCLFLNFIDPKQIFAITFSINIMIYCVVGGANSLWGPLIGAGLLYFVSRMCTMYLSTVLSDFSSLVFGVILLIVVYFAPGGIIGFIQERIEKSKFKKAQAAKAEESV